MIQTLDELFKLADIENLINNDEVLTDEQKMFYVNYCNERIAKLEKQIDTYKKMKDNIK